MVTSALLKMQAWSICAKSQVRRTELLPSSICITYFLVFLRSSTQLTGALLFICQHSANSCCSAYCPAWNTVLPSGTVIFLLMLSQSIEAMQETTTPKASRVQQKWSKSTTPLLPWVYISTTFRLSIYVFETCHKIRAQWTVCFNHGDVFIFLIFFLYFLNTNLY